MKIRPIHGISDFVAGGALARVLESPTKELSMQIELLVEALTSEHIARAQADNRVLACLDLKMMEAGLEHSSLEIPTKLIALVDNFSGDEKPVILYDEIVMTNPEEDMRIFTRGDVGASERMFYMEHKFAETRMADAVRIIRLVIDSLKHDECGGDSTSSSLHMLESVVHNVHAVIRITAKLRNEMDPAHFKVFRRFLMSHPTRGLKGPSGAFTARIPALDLLLHGERLPRSYMEYIEENWAYFPREGRLEITEILEYVARKQTLTGLWHEYGKPPILGAKLAAIGNALTAFRKMHYRAVEVQIPEAVRGEVPGTGGENDAGAFMRRRMEETKL